MSWGTIIRSAGMYEDGETLSFAGAYDSIPVGNQSSPEDRIETATKVVMSPYAPRGLRYHFFNGIPVQPIDIILQKLVPNAVALNFTVTPTEIPSVLVSNLGPRGLNLIFRPDAASPRTAFVNPVTNFPVEMDEGSYSMMKALVERVKPAFLQLAADRPRISVECAFDLSGAWPDKQIRELAFLQVRPLPTPKMTIARDLEDLSTATSKDLYLPVHTHLISGPCTFDSMLVIGTGAAVSRELGRELTAIAR